MKTHKEIHDAIQNMHVDTSLHTIHKMLDIMLALNDRIAELETESAKDYVDLNERVISVNATVRSLCDIHP